MRLYCERLCTCACTENHHKPIIEQKQPGVGEAGLHIVQVVEGVLFEVSGSQLHDGGLERIPPASPGDPYNAVVSDSAVGTTRVVESVKMG